MIDLETLASESSDAAIIQIGAAFFDYEDPIMEAFSILVHPEGAMEFDTLQWWFRQDDAALEVIIAKNRVPLHDALLEFTKNCEERLSKKADFWCNGATFDFPILRSAYSRCGLLAPWHRKKAYDMRTMKMLYPDIERVEHGTHHDAGDDAIAQALWIQKAMVHHVNR